MVGVGAVPFVSVKSGTFEVVHSLPPLKKKASGSQSRQWAGDGERGLVKGLGLKWVCWRREL